METAKQSLPDDVLIIGFMSMLPRKLQEDFLSLEREFESLTDVKAYALKQVQAHRDVDEMAGMHFGVHACSTKEDQGPDDTTVESALRDAGYEHTEDNKNLGVLTD